MQDTVIAETVQCQLPACDHILSAGIEGMGKMDEEFAKIYGIIWDKIYEALSHDDFKIALMLPPGYRGDERVADIRRIDMDIDRNQVIIMMLDGHRIIFMYDPEGRISELLYGARRRGSPDFESDFRVWLEEHDTLRGDRKQGKISQKEYNRLYVDWKQRQPTEEDPDYAELFRALSEGQISRDEFERAYHDLGSRKWPIQ